MFGRLIGRGVFTTVEGLVGLCPRDTDEGDLVCILYGCRLPFILRKHGRSYEFIVPAYVDGAMNGEVFHDSQKGDEPRKE
ncbi:hypothetical protein DM02DRAFT_620261 [Periconia macrospinosa]|uniref:Uncharacterized protein n=1 Tax=Periconia macrospinosa TaxID=97972 RepID=A0A2V1D325_9PLEO|nr:hypothetical protein DM02DRAFT_620261 [Periconia macrospinosa]